ncbi:ribosomal protein S27AE [Agrobacterium rubi]|nr:ribosomal protein S27AE [Agrobacterium rubi]
MKRRGATSLYVKAWLFLAVSAAAVMTSPDWSERLPAAFGWDTTAPGIAAFIAFNVIILFFIACPTCGLSLFKTDAKYFYIYHPWPNRVCPRCGRDHGQVERDQ